MAVSFQPSPQPSGGGEANGETISIGDYSVRGEEFTRRFEETTRQLTGLIDARPIPAIGAQVRDGDRLDAHTLTATVVELSARAVLVERAIRALQAQRARILAGIPRAYEESGLDSAATAAGTVATAAKIAAATRISDRTVAHTIQEADEIQRVCPDLFDDVACGAMSFPHAALIAQHAEDVTAEKRPEYLERARSIARETTPGRLKHRLPRLCDALSPQTVQERHARARGERRVWINDERNGMAMLGAVLPAPLAYAAFDRLTRLAKESTRDGFGSKPEAGGTQGGSASEGSVGSDARLLGHARADALLELLLTGTADRISPRTGKRFGAGVTGKISITVPLELLAGDERAGHAELHGYGVIDADLAKWLAADAKSWDRIFVDRQGTLLASDNYEPPAAIRRLVVARDRHCRFPGCNEPPQNCEFDHIEEWARGGKTSADNLALLCRRHHRLKHPDRDDASRWRVTHDGGGVLTWWAPTGEAYREPPDGLDAGPPYR